MTDANYTSNRSFNFMANESEIIGYFAQGQKHSISSQNLKLEYTETSIRLSSNTTVLIGISKQVNKWQRKVLLSNNSDYKDIIAQALAKIGFVAKQKSSHPEFTEYHYYQMPDGYKLNYTEVIQLWRAWWHHKRYQLNTSNSPIDVLIFSKGNWQSVQDLQPKQGSFILQTAKGKITIKPDEYIVWIDRTAATTSLPRQQPLWVDDRQLLGTDREEVSIESAIVNSDSLTKTDYLNRLPEAEEYIDLEAYLSTFNTEDAEDIDRIEGIYNIGELLRGSSPIDRSPTRSEPSIEVTPALAPAAVEPELNPKPLVSTPTSSQSSLSASQRQTSLKLKAMNVLAIYLEQGDLIVNTEVLKNAQGQEINRKSTKTQRGCPSWAIELINKL